MVHGLAGRWPAPPDRHLHGVDDQFGAHVISDRPADHPAAPGIEHHSEVHLALAGRVLGDVGDPQPVRALRRELAVDEVIAEGGVGVTTGAATASFVHPDDPVDPHQPLDPLTPDTVSLTQLELVVDPGGPIGAARPAVDLADPLDQLGVGDPASARMRLGVTPRIEPRRRHPEGAAQHRSNTSSLPGALRFSSSVAPWISFSILRENLTCCFDFYRINSMS